MFALVPGTAVTWHAYTCTLVTRARLANTSCSSLAQREYELKLDSDALQLQRNKVAHDAAMKSEALLGEQRRTLDLLLKEKAAAVGIAAAAEEKLRRAELDLKEVARRDAEIRDRLDRAEEQVGHLLRQSCQYSHAHRAHAI